MKNNFPDKKKILSLRDIVAKITCIFLAVILWLYIGSTNKGEVKFKIPVIFTNLPEPMMKSNVSSRHVTVTLTGRKDNLKNINIKSVKAEVNLSQAAVGINKAYPIELTRDEIPENIELNLSVREISLTVEKKIYKRVKVKVNIIDRPGDGYVVGGIKIFPDSVTVSGPESVVKHIDFIPTESISVANTTMRLIKDVAIETRNLPDINIDTPKVRLLMPVIKSADLTELRKKIILKNADERFNYVLSQDEVSVYLQSLNPGIKISDADVDLIVDIGFLDFEEVLKEGIGNFIEKNYSIDAVVKKDGVRIISVSPDIVSVKIIEK